MEHHTPPRRAGRIAVIGGPMFGGKSIELLRRIKRAVYGGRRCALVRSETDVRAEPDKFFTNATGVAPLSVHDARRADVAIVTVARLADAEAHPKWPPGCRDIFVDEGQFFPDLLAACVGWADAGACVTVAGLQLTAQQAPFGDMCALMGEAEDVTKMSAVCMRCLDADASFTVSRAPQTGTINIGGEREYMAVCRACRRAHISLASLGSP